MFNWKYNYFYCRCIIIFNINKKISKKISKKIGLITLIFIVIISIIFNFSSINSNLTNNNLKTSLDLRNIYYQFNSTEYYDFNLQTNEIATFYNCKENFDDNIIERTNYTDFELETIGSEKEEIEFVKEFTGNPSDANLNVEIVNVSNQKSLLFSDFGVNALFVNTEFFTDIYPNLIVNFTIYKLFAPEYFEIQFYDDLVNRIDILFINGSIQYYNSTHWVEILNDFISGRLYTASILHTPFGTYFSWECIYYKIETVAGHIDGFDQIKFRTASVGAFCESTQIGLNDFYINDYQDSKIVFDFSNISDYLPEYFQYYTYIMFNISGYIEFWNYNESLYHLPAQRTHLSNWSEISNNRMLFNSFYYFSYPNYNILVLKFLSQNISVSELKIFGYCFLSNAEYYGPISANPTDINNIYGILSSTVQNNFSEKFSLNYFYIDNIEKRFCFNVDFVDSNINYLSWEIKLFIKESLHKRTFIKFNSERNPKLISKAYLTLSHWGDYGYYNQSILLPDYTESSRIQLSSSNETWSTFEIIYFNVSDINDNLFTGYNVFGYISSFIVEYNILPSILITSLLIVLPPILVIVIPTLALSKSITKLIIPIFILMSIISFTVSLIPLWLLFIIISNLGMYIIMEEEF